MLLRDWERDSTRAIYLFQQAPTLGGECYKRQLKIIRLLEPEFQQAPTLGGECYYIPSIEFDDDGTLSFNKHPPLGVNATSALRHRDPKVRKQAKFQQAPTLGGECY